MNVRTGRSAVVVLHDCVPPGAPVDARDNLIQAREVADSLSRLGFEVHPVAFGRDLAKCAARLRAVSPVLVFNLVESVEGDGTRLQLAPAVLDALGLRYTGASAAAHVCTGDKRVAKHLLAARGLPTAKFAERVEELDAWGENEVGIVKPACEDASVAIDAGSVVRGRHGLERELRSRQARFGGEWFVEQYVDGREFNASILCGGHTAQVLPVAEIEFLDYPPGRPRIVDYEAKWHAGSFAFQNTPRRFDWAAREPDLLARLESMARACHDMFALGGYSRVDFRLSAEGEPFVLEVNANPCLSSDAGFMAAVRQAGMGPDEAIARIVESTGVACPSSRPASDADLGSKDVLYARFARR